MKPTDRQQNQATLDLWVRRRRYALSIPEGVPHPENVLAQAAAAFPGLTPSPPRPAPEMGPSLPDQGAPAPAPELGPSLPPRKPKSLPGSRRAKRRVPAGWETDDTEVMSTAQRIGQAQAADANDGIVDLAKTLTKPGTVDGLSVLAEALLSVSAGQGISQGKARRGLVRWDDLGVSPVGMPEEHRFAIEMLSPQAPRPWRRTARKEQLAVVESRASVSLFLAGRGAGKAVALDTPIPTPEGWRLIGDLAPGDAVFDESGRPCRITAVYDRQPEVAYRVGFSDGTSVDACDEHQWVTWTHSERKAYLRSAHEPDRSRFPAEWPAWRSRQVNRWGTETSGGGPQTRTTQEIVDTLRQNGTRGDLNHSIPTCGDLQQPHRSVPVDPWLLGYWLGDGTTIYANITVHEDDLPHVTGRLDDLGQSWSVYRGPRTPRVNLPGGLRVALRTAGVLGNKHVPEDYLWASAEQRADLLAGLMDSDGTTSGRQVEFCSVLPQLADAVMQLARSLGQKPVLAKGRSMLNGVDYGPRYRVTWTPTRQVFTLPRKADQVRLGGAQSLRNHHRMIVSAEPIVDPGIMRCLTVDSRHRTYLCGEGMIPTHNTFTCSNGLTEDAVSNRGDYAAIGPTLGDAVKIMTEGPSGLLKALGEDLERFDKSKLILYLRNGSRIVLASAERPDRLRGWNLSGAWVDELGSYGWRADVLWNEALQPALREGANPRVFVSTTPRRGIKLLRDLIARGQDRKDTDVSLHRGRTADNVANLSAGFLDRMKRLYQGTALERQELDGELLGDVDGSLVSVALMDRCRVDAASTPPLSRVVVAVDPAVTSSKTSDSTGICVVGLGAAPPGRASVVNGPHAYVLHSEAVKMTPQQAMKRVLALYQSWQADVVVVEKNNGGDYIPGMLSMVSEAERTMVPRIVTVTASDGKRTRAEPISALFEQGRAHMVGAHPELEDEWTSWVPGEQSPDQLDACIAEGQLVATERGDVPVEQVKVGDQVWTRAGLRSVTWAGCTRTDADVFVVESSDGSSVAATADHRVWTGRGWQRVDALVWGDILSTWPTGKLSSRSVRSGRGTPIQRTDQNGSTSSRSTAGSTSMSQCGSTTRGVQLFPDFMFTTSISTRSTTSRATWSNCLRWITAKRTARWSTLCELRPSGLSTWRRFAPRPPNGMLPMRAAVGTRSTAPAPGIIGSRLLSDCASSVVNSLRLCGTRLDGALGSASTAGIRPTAPISSRTTASSAERSSCAAESAQSAAPARVVSVRALGTSPRVYDLTVEGEHEFYAGGILVHNCVWGIVELIPETAKAARPRFRIIA